MAKFLYNGIPLPPLPEWDREAYPYAVIFYRNSLYELHYLDTRPYYDETISRVCWVGARSKVYNAGDESEAWTLAQENESADETVGAGRFNWSNTDLLTSGGVVFLAASDPIPVPSIDHTAMIQGWIVGKRLAAQRGKRKPEPVAYLYNGVRLPKLPEWDREMYPYAYIAVVTDNRSILYCFSSYYYDYGPLGEHRLYFNPPWIRYNFLSPTDTTWEYLGAHASVAGHNISDAVWSNFDILNEDGTVYLAASEPIPVYE